MHFRTGTTRIAQSPTDFGRVWLWFAEPRYTGPKTGPNTGVFPQDDSSRLLSRAKRYISLVQSRQVNSHEETHSHMVCRNHKSVLTRGLTWQ